jgi:uncharacterized protein (DUF433 family)
MSSSVIFAARSVLRQAPGKVLLMRNEFSMSTAMITRREAAQLSGTALNVVNKAIEQKVISARKRNRRTLLAIEEVGGLTLLEQVRLSLPVALKKRIVVWVRTRPAPDAELRLDGALVVRMSLEVAEAVTRAERYVELRERLVDVDPEVCGGEPVITGTRMPVRSLARLIELGETREVLREDYPWLTEDSFELAPLWAQANPRQGRPPRPWTSGERTPVSQLRRQPRAA